MKAKTIKQRFLLGLLLWGLVGCASELRDDETMARIRAQLANSNDVLAIQENPSKQTGSGGSPYQAARQGKSSSRVFEVEPATGHVVNPKAPRPQKAPTTEQGSITLNFENADLREVVKFVMTDLLQQNYILSPAVQGQVTLQTSEPISRADLLPTLETLLKINGAVIVETGDIIRILPLAEANRGTLAPKVGKIHQQKPGYEVRIIPLKYISAAEAQKNLEPFLPNGSLLSVDPIKNILTVAGTGNELANIQQTIDTFDVDWLKGMSVGLYHLQHVSIGEIMPELEGLFGQGGNTPFAGLFQFIPMEKNNAIMVITRQASYLSEAHRWLERLDTQGSEEQERLYVYRVQNGRAEDLAGVLSGIFSASGSSNNQKKTPAQNRDQSVAIGQVGKTVSSDDKPATTPTVAPPLTGGGNIISGAEATISADEVNNALVIKATPANYDLVLQALRQLDVPKLQVLLDVVVAEINLSGSLSMGFQYWLQEGEKDNRQGVTLGGVGPDTITDAVANSFQYTLNNIIPGRLNLAINALAKNGLAQFLSTPSLMVLDNETASMNVGEKISISNSYTDKNGNVVNGTSYVDTGVQLNVTPRVTAGGNVQLNITQSVSRQAPNASGAQGNPNIYNRDITSVISARNGQTIVLGGLIQEQTASNRNGVPILQSLPGVGPLFRSTGRNKSRTELIVLITPQVSRHADDTLRITKEFRSRMQGLDIYNETQY